MLLVISVFVIAVVGLELQLVELRIDAVAEINAEDDQYDDEGKNEGVANGMVFLFYLHHFYLGGCYQTQRVCFGLGRGRTDTERAAVGTQR